MAENTKELVLYKHSNALVAEGDDVEMKDTAEPIHCKVPEWLYNAATELQSQLKHFDAVVRNVQERGNSMEKYFPQMSQLYQDLLSRQNDLYDLATQDLQQLQAVQQNQYQEISLAAQQFSHQVETALRISKEQNLDALQAIIKETEWQAVNTKNLMSFVGQLAQETVAEVNSLRANQTKITAKLTSLERQAKHATRAAQRQKVEFEQHLIHKVGVFVDKTIADLQATQPQQAIPELKKVAKSIKAGKSLDEAVQDFTHRKEGVQTTPEATPGSPLSAPPSNQQEQQGAAPPPPPPPPSSSASDVGSYSSSDDAREQRELAIMEQLRRVEEALIGRSSVTVQRPKVAPPTRYSGAKGKIEFRPWLLAVEEYFLYYQDGYKNDSEKIITVGSMLEGDASIWYTHRREEFTRQHLVDNWTAFTSAMEARFINRREVDDAANAMWSTKYEGDIDTYITRLETLNLRVNVNGPIWRNVLKHGLIEDIRDHLSHMSRTDDDIEYRESVREAGRRYEERLKERKIDPRTSGATSKPRTERKRHDDKASASGSGIKRVFHSRDEALAGIPLEIIEARSKEGVCLRCGKKGHRWSLCKGKAVTETVEPRRVSGQKRKSVEVDVREAPKRYKIASSGSTSMPVELGGKIYEDEGSDHDEMIG